MFRLILLGMLSAAFFSSTFVLNRVMSIEGGHWLWTASLRFGYMLAFLVAYFIVVKGPGYLGEILRLFVRFRFFWMTAGSIGFGVFYSLLTFSAACAPAWIIATTWQVTILATPVVLLAFGKKVPARGLLFTGIMFAGIVMANMGYAATAEARDVVLGIAAVLVAAFAYPAGNQMVWESTHRGTRLIPHIDHPVMEDPFARILMLTAGSVPFWGLLFALSSPPPPSPGQLISTAVVALLSGVIATSLFFHARHLCRHPYEIAAVDASQSMEVVFSLIGEILFLGAALPTPAGWAGIALTTAGLVAYTRQHYRPETPPSS